MKKSIRSILLSLSAMLLLLTADISSQLPLVLSFVPEAAAVIGRPWTPVSFAGVARRTTRRAVIATSAASTTVVVAAPAQTASVPIGTVVTTLPAGCVVTTIGNVEYHQCASVYYRAAFQGNTLVYVATQP